MKQRLFSSIMLTFFLVSIAFAIDTKSISSSVRTSYNTKNYDSAITTARILLTAPDITQVDRDEALNIISYSYYNKKDYSNALTEFKNIVDHYPNCKYHDNSLIMVGYCYKLSGDSKNAILTFCAVIQNYPDTDRVFQAQNEIASMYLNLRNSNSILLTDLQSNVLFQKLLPNCLYVAGDVQFNKRKNYSKAQAYYQELVTTFPDTKEANNARLMLAKCNKEIGNTMDALMAYSDIIQRNPTDQRSFEAQYAIASTYMSMKTTNNDAMISLNSNSTLQSLLPMCLYVAGDVEYNKRKDYSQAAVYYQEILDHYKDDIKLAENSIMMLGRCYKKLQNYEKSIESFKRILTEFPPNNHCNEAQMEIVNIMNLQAKSGDEIRKEALKLNDFEHPRGRLSAMYTVVNSLISEGKKQEAIDWLKKAIQDNPNNPYLDKYKEKLDSMLKD